jgi:DNA-binding GntR family transcriptional regulator
MILSGELSPGSVLLQAEMARKLGVSRTPMREAFRLLQEEGLIDARPDQRARVRGVDPEDLDGVYGARIMLETLAVSMTAKTLTTADLERMGDVLNRMQELAGDDQPDEWHAAHKEFHRIATQAVAPHLQRMLASLGEHSERYIRLAQLGVPASWGRAHTDHEALLEALRLSDPDEAARVIARHLARTALSVLADVAPEYEPAATRTALGIAGNGQS